MSEIKPHNGAPRVAAFRYALRGLVLLFTQHPHGRFHAMAALVVLLLAIVLDLARWEWIALLLCIGAVISMEALNSALEELADALHPDHHPGIGRAKDLAAGAVLFVAVVAALVGALILLPPLLHHLK